jgi:hypothetical protein
MVVAGLPSGDQLISAIACRRPATAVFGLRRCSDKLRRASGDLRRLFFELRRQSDELRRPADELRRRFPTRDGLPATCDAYSPTCDGQKPLNSAFFPFCDDQKPTVKTIGKIRPAPAGRHSCSSLDEKKSSSVRSGIFRGLARRSFAKAAGELFMGWLLQRFRS